MNMEELAQTLDIEVEVIEWLRELERRERVKKQRAGIEQAKARGVQFGRPRVPIRDMDKVVRLYTSGQISLDLAAVIAGVSRSTIHRRIREHIRGKP